MWATVLTNQKSPSPKKLGLFEDLKHFYPFRTREGTRQPDVKNKKVLFRGKDKAFFVLYFLHGAGKMPVTTCRYNFFSYRR